MALYDDVIVFGEDVARKGGVYGVTRTLLSQFGGDRVSDKLLDEQTILGTALGAAISGFLPIPEIQYLAYMHNAEDQIRGEAATLCFFSNNAFATEWSFESLAWPIRKVSVATSTMTMR
jgi:2-oxoisovalerate dehydrogenase E1 component